MARVSGRTEAPAPRHRGHSDTRRARPRARGRSGAHRAETRRRRSGDAAAQEQERRASRDADRGQDLAARDEEPSGARAGGRRPRPGGTAQIGRRPRPREPATADDSAATRRHIARSERPRPRRPTAARRSRRRRRATAPPQEADNVRSTRANRGGRARGWPDRARMTGRAEAAGKHRDRGCASAGSSRSHQSAGSGPATGPADVADDVGLASARQRGWSERSASGRFQPRGDVDRPAASRPRIAGQEGDNVTKHAEATTVSIGSSA